MASLGDYILLPKGTMESPNDGIIYGQIMEAAKLESKNPFNRSGKKRKTGWSVTIYVDPQTTLVVPKHVVITTTASEILEDELESRPRELLGGYVVKGLQDTNGDTFVNYGQIDDVVEATDDAPSQFMVKFRPLADGTELMPQAFPESELTGCDVTIEQYVLGLGMGKNYDDPEATALRYADELEDFGTNASLASWTREFGSVVIAPTTTVVLNNRLERQELDVERLLQRFKGLQGLIGSSDMDVPQVERTLRNDFASFSIDSSPGLIETKPTSQPPAAAQPPSMFGNVPVGMEGVVSTPPSNVVSMQSRNNVRQMMRQTGPPAQAPQVAVQGTGPSAYDPATFKQQHMANKMAFVPTEPQMHKHAVTFKSGVYGKSTTKLEHMGGIEVVFEIESQLAPSRAMAQIRTLCLMTGAAHTAPMQVWESADAMSFLYEESYDGIKWTKTPEVQLVPVDDLEHFWRLYNQFQLAVNRYYVDDYRRVLEHVKQNLIAGFLQYGGNEQFASLTKENRITTLQCAVKYMRAVVGKFMNEVLLPQVSIPVVQWLGPENVQSALFFGQVSSKWQTIQLRDLRSQTIFRPQIVKKEPGAPALDPQKPKKNTLSKALAAKIPKSGGVNLCLMSYTNRGCKNKDCQYVNKKAGDPELDLGLQKWLIDTAGSYKGP